MVELTMASLICLSGVLSKYIQSHKARGFRSSEFQTIDEGEFSRQILSSVVYTLVAF